MPLFVIEEKDEIVARLKKRGIEAVAASAPSALVAANLAHARALLVAVPEAFEAGQIVTQARAANRDLFIVAHAHSDTEAAVPLKLRGECRCARRARNRRHHGCAAASSDVRHAAAADQLRA